MSSSITTSSGPPILRMYGVNGGPGFEWDGETLAPVVTTMTS